MPKRSHESFGANSQAFCRFSEIIMGWIDREYSRPRGEPGGIAYWLMRILNGSVYLGRWWGIAVRVHATLIFFLVAKLFMSGGDRFGMISVLASSAILFVIVLLHEFGHCFAARSVGGDADEILLWPLGGLAFVRTPQRPWPTFVGVAGGPLVNVLICLASGGALLAMSKFQFRLPWNPLSVYSGSMYYHPANLELFMTSEVAFYLFWIFGVSYSLLLFNLLPIFPLDGGQIFQTILWPRLGYYKSMDIACVTGMVGAAIFGILGLAGNNGILLLIAISGFFACQQMRMSLQEYGEPVWMGQTGDYPAPPRRTRRQKPAVPRDDANIKRRLSPLEWYRRRRRKKQFERLMKDD